MAALLIGISPLIILVAALGVGLGGKPAQAAHVGLRFPIPAGQVWQICCGYNTGTHTDIDPHAIDLVRVDGPTAGSTVLAPISGRVSGTTSGSSCITIRDSHGLIILICHVYAVAGLRSGDNVITGQEIATVAPAGEAANNGLAHIHLAIHRSFNSGVVQTVPFTGDYALEGVEMADTTQRNAYAGQQFTSTNVTQAPLPPTPTPPANRQPARTTASASASVSANDPYAPGLNSVVVMGGGSASSIALRIASESRRPVQAIWVLSRGQWSSSFPPFPSPMED